MDPHSQPHESASGKQHFVSLLTAHYYQVHGFILTMVPNKTDAEDVLQNTIIYMWEHFNDFNPGTRFSAWAVTIAKFQVLTYRKKQTRSKLHFSEKAIDLIAAEHTRLSTQVDDRHEALQKCLEKLPQPDFDFLKKRFMRGLSVQKLADEIGTSMNVVYKKLSRLKGLLLNCVQRTLASQGL